MSLHIDPWGSMDWLLGQVGSRTWHTITCAASEERSIAVPSWAADNLNGASHHLIRIDDSPSRYSPEMTVRTDKVEAKIRALLTVMTYWRADLMSSVPTWAQAAAAATVSGSVLLDISSMPKRVFLFLMKCLLDSDKVRDLVISYTRPAKYPEGALSESALPPAFMPGYAREANHESESTLVVGVGYVAFDLEELLEQRDGKTLKFLLPFPPGSPATRRNWRLLNMLNPTLRRDTEVRRIHMLDTFEVLRWIRAVGESSNGSFDMLPLGPKPHAVAMGLAHRILGSRAQLTYAQPTVYRPDYSIGIGVTSSGKADIAAYCLRRNGVNMFA